MNNQSKRIAIAKDVIERVNKKFYLSTQGYFCESVSEKLRNFPLDKSVRELILDKRIGKCEVCALGATLLSCIALNNKVTVQDFYNESDIGENISFGIKFHSNLDKIFSKKQLILIEVAFEMGGGYFNVNYDNTQLKLIPKSYISKAIAFGKKFKTLEQRLLGIMNNIVENNGQFKP
jgi:hypothetical protein